MSNWVFLVWYILIMLYWLAFWYLRWDHGRYRDAQRSARMILLSPIFPIIFIYLIVRNTPAFISEVIKDAR